MKKLVFVLVILAVLVGGGYGYYEHQRQNLRASLDQVIIPYLKQEYKAQSGKELNISYGQAELDGRELNIKKLACDFEYKGQNHLDWEEVTLTVKGWSWLWGAYLFDLKAKKNATDLPKASFTIAEAEGKGLAMKEGGDSLTMDELVYRDILLKVKKTKGKADEFKADELKLTGIKTSFGDEAKGYTSSADMVSLVSGEYRVEVEGISGRGKGLVLADKFSLRGDYDVKAESFKVNKKDKALVSAGVFESSHRGDEKGYHEKISLRKLSFSIPEKVDEQDFSHLHKAGIKDVVLNISSKFSHELKGAVTKLDSFAIEAEKLGKLELGGLVENLALEQFQDPKLDDQKTMRILGAARLAELNLAYHDQGLVPKIYQIVADRNRQTPQQVQVSAAGGVAIAAFGVAKDSKELSRVLVKIAAFLNKPESICISLKPARPVPFAAMISPEWQPVVKMLNPTAGDCSAKKEQNKEK